ncbi:hypothetical protein TR2A62_0996 [Thalassobium sp. R2A62]|nr:hypothetical protein TR2A62_0996 [Thalassobium sp. R2A62]
MVALVVGLVRVQQREVLKTGLAIPIWDWRRLGELRTEPAN